MPILDPSIRARGPIPSEALAFLRAKSLRTSFSWLDIWGEEHSNAFTVAKATDDAVLSTLFAAVDRALAEGRTLRSFQLDLVPELQRLGWWGVQEVVDPTTGEDSVAELGSPRRLKLIFDANLRSARAAGQWERIQRTKAVLPYLLYELGPSEHHRPEHASWAGTILPVDDVFWTTHFTPNGWGCKCRIRALSAAEAARRGGPTKRPPLNLQPFLNKRTGETVLVPRGIDPGWGHNPGLQRFPRAA